MTQTDGGLSLVFGEDLASLVGPFSDFVYSAPGDILSPAWSVVPTMSIRQWLDQDLSRSDSTGEGGVSANLLSIFAKDLAVRIEQLALGEEWRDFGTETTALRILGAISLSSFDDARRRAQAIDEIVRWRPHLLEPTNQAKIPDPVREAMDALNFFDDGAAAQRSKVLAKLRSGEVEGLPTQLAVFGLANVPGGQRFMDLLEAIASQIPVRCFLPVPSVEMARAMSEGGAESGDEGSLPFSWTRDAREALSLWLTPFSERTFLAPVDRPDSLLGLLQRRVLGDASATERLDDNSVRLLGGFGDSRQAEQLRDFLLDAIAKGVAPHEILVVSPKPAEFEQALERHWSYQTGEAADPGPRLPNELIEVSPTRLDNRLGVSLALLRLIGSYVTVEQVASLLTMPSVSRTLGISFDDTQLIQRRAKEGKLIFGISAEQRDRFDVYPREGGSMPPDIGTWERLSDAVAAATLYPPPADDEATRQQPVPGVGESGDLRLFGQLQPLLRILEEADHLRPAGALEPSTDRRTLADWLDQLSSWMSQVAASDGDDDSFERVLLRLERALASDPSLGEVSFDLEQLVELWVSLAQARTFSRIFGRGGVVVAGLDALAFAPFRVVCILGLDEEKLPPSVLPSQIMGSLPAEVPAGERSLIGDPDSRRAVHGGLLAALLSAREQLCISWNALDEGTGAGIDPSIALAELLVEVAAAANEDTSILATSAASSARRHGFSGKHDSVRFDTRILRIDNKHQEFEPTLVELSKEIPLPTLRQFYRDPLGRHLRQAQNVLIPQRLEESPTRPAIEVDNLTLHNFRTTYVSQIMELDAWGGVLDRVHDESSYLDALGELKTKSAPIFDELCSSEEFVGDVPRIFWLKAELKEQLDLYAFNLAFELADSEPITSLTATELAPIDLGEELGVITLVSAHGSRAARFEPRRMLDGSGVVVIQQRPKVGKSAKEVQGRLLSQLVELLALRINNPGLACRVLSVFAPENVKIQTKNMTKESVPKGAYRMNPYFELSASPESVSADQARHQLEILVRIYWRGMREILPLFAETTETLAFDGWSSKLSLHAKSSWEGGYMKSGDKDDIPSLLHFPLSWRQLRSREEVNQLAQSLRPAGRGVEFWWGSATSRPAPLTLRHRHAGFATKEEAVRQGIGDAAGDDEAAKFKRVTSALVWSDDA